MTKPVLLHVYPSFEVGGTQRRLVRIANQFGQDYRHLILSLDGRTDAAALLKEGLDLRLLSLPAEPRGPLARLALYSDLLRRWRPDRLITANWGSIEWAIANLARGVPHLHLEDGFGREEADGQLARRVWTRRLVLRRSRVIVPSRTLWRLAREVWRLPENRLLYLPNGVDLSRFAVKTRRRTGADEPVIGTVAALRPEKNIGRLLEAFAALRQRRPARLRIAGDGPLRGALEQQADRLGIASDVRFIGNCPTPEQFLSELDLFVLSSDTEQMPLSLLEAMAAGLPVVATDVGDVRDMLPAEQQDFIGPRDAGRLADNLSRLLDDEALRDRLGLANADSAARRFDEKVMFAAYRRLYDGRED